MLGNMETNKIGGGARKRAYNREMIVIYNVHDKGIS